MSSNHPYRPDRKYAFTGMAVELGAIPLEAPAGITSWSASINFRETAGYVTDDTGQTYCLNESYPTSRDGLTFGFTDGLGGDRVRNRDSGLDPRLAGGHFSNSSGSQDRVLVFELDLPTAGDYRVKIACGDPFNTRVNQKAEVFDDTSSLGVIVNDASTAAGAWVDASNTERTNEADWLANSAFSADLTFATTTFVLKIGTTNADSSQTFLAHLFVEYIPAAGGYTLAVDPGSYALTGTAANLEQGYELAAAVGSYALTGTAASLKQGYEVAGAVGSYVINGTDATLTYTPVSETLSADAGSYSLTGTAASLEQGYRLTCAPGSYSLAGTDATLTSSSEPPAPTAGGGASGGGGDDATLLDYLRRRDAAPKQGKKTPYLKAVREASKPVDPTPELDSPKRERKQFKEPEVIYKKRATPRAAVQEPAPDPEIRFESYRVPELTAEDAAKRRLAERAELEARIKAQEAVVAGSAARLAEIEEQILVRRRLLEQERLANEIEQDDEEVILLLLVNL